MNREIKFKFVIDGKHLSKPYTLDELIEISEEKIFEDMEVCTCSLNESNNHCEGDCIRFDNSDITDKIQYTGLVDKNEVEVYDGDILTNDGIYFRQVKWFRNGFWICQLNSENKFPIVFVNENKLPEFEVIGNIYENPELSK